MTEAFVFEVGKCYEHNTGKRIHIVAEAELDIYFSPCLIAETDSGGIIPVGKSEENAVNYHEITREEWLNTFKSSFVSEVEAEYGNGWTPCEKELPPQPEENPEFEGKPLEVYLVSFKGTKYPWRAFWNGKNFTDGWGVVHPEAWMPLPEPYKPEKGAQEC